jgi:hypothetical protein
VTALRLTGDWSLGRYLLCWLLLLLVAIGNGMLREASYGRFLPERTAHQLSTLTGIVFTGLCAWLLLLVWPLQTALQAWQVGMLWLLLTIGFEFLFGRYVAGHSWERLLYDYNLAQGRVWLLFLLWIAVMPYLFFRLG